MEYNLFLKNFKKLQDQTTRYVPPNARTGIDNYDRYVDFPYVEDPTTYTTYKPLEQSASGRRIGQPPQNRTKLATEQEEDKKEPAIDPEGAGEEAGEAVDVEGGLPEDMATGDVGGEDMMGATGDAAGGMDSIGAMGGEKEEPLSSSQVGRVYELKKIYSRLSSIESYLTRETDETIQELRKYVSQSIDLFEVVMANYDQFKDKVDEIIVQYYQFLEQVYTSLEEFYKRIEKD